MGRIIEEAPGNLSTMLRGRQNPSHHYHVQDNNQWNQNEDPSQYDHPSSSWHSQWQESEAYPAYAVPHTPYVYLADQEDSGTDTDTSSDYGDDLD